MNQMATLFGHKAKLAAGKLRPEAKLLVFVFSKITVLPQIFLSTKYGIIKNAQNITTDIFMKYISTVSFAMLAKHIVRDKLYFKFISNLF